MVQKALWEVKYKYRIEALKKETRTHKKFLPFVMQLQPSLPTFEKHNHRQIAYTEGLFKEPPLEKENHLKAFL